MGRGKRRFPGAGGSAEREFNRLRWRNVRGEWRIWAALVLFWGGAGAASFLLSGVPAIFLAGSSGALFGMLFTMWALGGHVSTYFWWLGAEGERETAKQIEGLDSSWYCVHDIEHEHGNWDHVLVGPPGVFLLDSKWLSGNAKVEADALRAGRLVFRGSMFRRSAMDVRDLILSRLGRVPAPWVQAVAVVWGDFPQGLVEEEHVIYVRGDKLQDWLAALPQQMTGPQRSALETAVDEVRTELRAAQDEWPRVATAR